MLAALRQNLCFAGDPLPSCGSAARQRWYATGVIESVPFGSSLQPLWHLYLAKPVLVLKTRTLKEFTHICHQVIVG